MPETPARYLPRAAASALLALVTLFALGVAAYFVTGNRVHVVETPSMGTYAPVGTLVLSRPVGSAQITPGQTVLFAPPGSHETYFHRVHALTASGIETKGDLNNQPDPWRLSAKNITGLELAHVPVLGWLFKVLPILLIGGVLLWCYARFFVERYWVAPTVLFGVTAILSVANFVVHPFVQATLLDKRVQNRLATVNFVNTGLLPLDVNVNGVIKVAKQGVVFTAQVPVGKGGYTLTSAPHVEWWGAILIGATLLAPTLLAVGYLIRQRVTNRDWHYVPLKHAELPPGTVVDVSDPVRVGDAVLPRYITTVSAPAQPIAGGLWASEQERAAFYEHALATYLVPQR